MLDMRLLLVRSAARERLLSTYSRRTNLTYLSIIAKTHKPNAIKFEQEVTETTESHFLCFLCLLGCLALLESLLN